MTFLRAGTGTSLRSVCKRTTAGRIKCTHCSPTRPRRVLALYVLRFTFYVLPSNRSTVLPFYPIKRKGVFLVQSYRSGLHKPRPTHCNEKKTQEWRRSCKQASERASERKRNPFVFATMPRRYMMPLCGSLHSSSLVSLVVAAHYVYDACVLPAQASVGLLAQSSSSFHTFHDAAVCSTRWAAEANVDS